MRTERRTRLAAGLLGLALVPAPGLGLCRADERPPPRPQEAPRLEPAGEGSAELAALQRGLEFLRSAQAELGDGSFPRGGGRHHVPVAVAALAALAFMAAGSTPERGPHGAALAAAIDYLLARADMAPSSPTRGYLSSEGDGRSRMHGHAFATLALAQAWSMSPRTTRGRRIEEVLRAATALIESSQGVEGGWYYEPRSSFEHENSVTVCLVQALRAAHGAGIAVDARRVERAIDYIRRCQTEDGSFRYALASGETSLALTAAGLVTLQSAGVYEGPAIERAAENLWRRLGARDAGGRTEVPFPFYERFYVSQALWQLSDTRLYRRWFAEERGRVLSAQGADGSWPDREHGSCYATAMNCLFLALPDGLLPAFQR